MRSSPAIGVGIVGLGFGASVHLPAFRLLEPLAVRVAALCARDRARARALAAEQGVPAAYGDWQDLVDDPAVDLVSIATPPSSHFAIALAALRAGKAVLCEKPLTLGVGEAEELADAARESTRPTLVNLSYRAIPAFRVARESLARGDVGRPFQLEASWHVDARLRAPAGRSWKDQAEEGGGALAAYGIHALDYAQWLLGPVARVFGRLDLFVPHQAGPDRSEDSCTVLLEFESGARATLAISTVAAGEPVHRIDIRGDRGRVVIENTDREDPVRLFTVTLHDRKGAAQKLPVGRSRWRAARGQDPRIEPFAVHAVALIEAARGGPAAEPSFDDGLRAQRLFEAVRVSAASERWVSAGGDR